MRRKQRSYVTASKRPTAAGQTTLTSSSEKLNPILTMVGLSLPVCRPIATLNCPNTLDDYPSHILEYLTDIEENEDARDVVKKVRPDEAGPLAKCLRDKIARDQESMPYDIENELKVFDHERHNVFFANWSFRSSVLLEK